MQVLESRRVFHLMQLPRLLLVPTKRLCYNRYNTCMIHPYQLDKIAKILQGMIGTMNSVKPPRMTALRELHEAETGSPLSILIGTILSARTRDENTSAVVKKLFTKYKSASSLAQAKLSNVEKIIKSTGFYHVKAKRIIEVASLIDSKYSGKVPDSLDELLKLPGVGRKTANCVLVYAFDKPAIPVYTHFHSISNRLGLVQTKTPEETEIELMKKIPKK